MRVLPTLRVNAWTGEVQDSGSLVSATGGRWAGAEVAKPPQLLAPEPLADPSDWRHPEVGWGLVLPEAQGGMAGDLARAADAPEPLQRLVAARAEAPVFRYRAAAPLWALRRYNRDGSLEDLSLVDSPRGVGPGRIPRYLLLCGAPRELPWSFQYRLQGVACVGRLDLAGEALERYVAALLTDWADAQSRASGAVVWAVDHGGGDITSLMRDAVAAPIAAALAGDEDFAAGTTFIDGRAGGATVGALRAALTARRPGLVVTTSHGMTGPLEDVPRMAAQMGLPVDEERALVDPAALVAAWQPDGAIWYAHACCSAGSTATSAYAGLLETGSPVDQLLRGLTAAGDQVAPLPQLMLSAERPLRAFVGHVEPTFDWTLRHPRTGQMLSAAIVEALYRRLYQPSPIGLAFAESHRQASVLHRLHAEAKVAYAAGTETLTDLLAYRLLACDRDGMVILGDPTVALPALRANGPHT